MSEIQATYDVLAEALHYDPLFCLANAVCWLDPFWQDAQEDNVTEEDHVETALRVLRTAFPDVYVLAVDALRQGASYNQMDQLICSEVAKCGLPIDHLDSFSYGIPMPAYGASLEDPDFYTHHPDVRPIIELFGIDLDADEYSVDVPHCAYTAGQLIAESLEEDADPRYRQLSRLMGWLFSCTGNSSIDYNDDAMCECQPLSWDQDDLAFALDIIQEADAMLSDALAGLEWIRSEPIVQKALKANIQQISRYLAKQKKGHAKHKTNIRLVWPSFTPLPIAILAPL
jgi:hypothetical protein